MAWPKRSMGGVRQWALTMANALVARGYVVEMLSEAPVDRFVDEPLLDARVGRVVLGKGIAAQWRLIDYVRRYPGVRIVAALDHYNLAAARLKRLFGARVHVMLTQRENLSADRVWRKRFKYWRIAHQVRRRFNHADAVVTVSRGLAADLRDNFGVAQARLHVIYNPAFRDSFVQALAQPPEHPWLNDKRHPVVLAAGRLHYVKGFDDLVEAFALLRRSLDARLIILGEGRERPALEAQIARLGLQDLVSLPGRVPSTAPWMARADVYALSSRREGLPAVLIEALAAGLPIVASRCPSGPDEILDNGRFGRLVPPGAPAAMATALAEVLAAPREPDLLRARAQDFSLDRALEQYLTLWRQPAQAPSRRPQP